MSSLASALALDLPLGLDGLDEVSVEVSFVSGVAITETLSPSTSI